MKIRKRRKPLQKMQQSGILEKGLAIKYRNKIQGSEQSEKMVSDY